MKIYKFLQHGEWPVLIMAKTKAKAKYALYRFAQAMSRGGYDSFMEWALDVLAFSKLRIVFNL